MHLCPATEQIQATFSYTTTERAHRAAQTKKKQKQKYHQRQKSTELAHRAALKTQQQSWPDTRYKTNQRQKTPETKNTRDKKHQRQKITRDEKQKQEKTQQSMKGRNRWLWVKTPYPWFPHH